MPAHGVHAGHDLAIVVAHRLLRPSHPARLRRDVHVDELQVRELKQQSDRFFDPRLDGVETRLEFLDRRAECDSTDAEERSLFGGGEGPECQVALPTLSPRLMPDRTRSTWSQL